MTSNKPRLAPFSSPVCHNSGTTLSSTAKKGVPALPGVTGSHVPILGVWPFASPRHALAPESGPQPDDVAHPPANASSGSISAAQFRSEAAVQAKHALRVAADIMRNEELSPAVRLEAGKWLTKVADLEPKGNAPLGDEKFCIVIQFGNKGVQLGRQPPEAPGILDHLLPEDAR